ncbi:M23 family metallopeptidase [Paenimyroides tangerinum]|uniref:M23 family metallopeptidase n=1 Tax=Paenimyroides tangerinum TaxID=2488728 RepID=A0A3P3WC80_9FLAO|nr:M23 family metallopeptidase [Paenimyroides tangerinum]RRJ92781.1 M23 family metallopeptidase [Paenimyroides tangerinum]
MKNFIAAFILFSNLAFSQDYPQDYFGKPLGIDLNVTGSFGELRYNHFHSGVDFGSNRKIGDPIFAVADGEVVRIQINEKGYGKVIYIKHPNGFTSVYAHLNDYSGGIRDFVKANQYKEKKYALEMFPLKNELIVKKGDVIGYVGNTGSSGGAHLHYEIRDTQSEEIINPFLFGVGYLISDVEKPIINSLVVYPISTDAVANYENIPIILSLNKQSDGVYISEKVNAKGIIGFGVNTYDVMNNRYSKNGVYKLETFLNGSKTYEIIFDRFSFDETRKINLLIDYERLGLTKERVQKLFKSANFDLNLIKSAKNNGKIEVGEGESYNYKIVISDFHNNKTEINVPINFSKNQAQAITSPNQNLKKIDSKRDYILSENNGTVEWEALTFYDDCELDIVFSENEIKIHRDLIPLDKSMTVQFDISNSNLNPQKVFIGLVNGNSISHFYTWKKNNKLSIRTKSLGTYKIFEDLEIPLIKSVNFTEGNNLTMNDVLVFEIEDKLSGIKEINGYINEEWALFEYEYKDKKITHHLKDGIAKKGLNKVLISVTDQVGNNSIFETNFQMN